MKPNIRLAIEEKAGEASDFEATERAQDWKLLRHAWFELKSTVGQQREQGEQMQATWTHTGKSRFIRGLHANVRCRDRDRIFNVQSVVNENENNRYLLWRLVESSS